MLKAMAIIVQGSQWGGWRVILTLSHPLPSLWLQADYTATTQALQDELKDARSQLAALQALAQAAEARSAAADADAASMQADHAAVTSVREAYCRSFC